GTGGRRLCERARVNRQAVAVFDVTQTHGFVSDRKRAAPAPRPYNLAAAQEGRQRRRNVVGALLIAALVVGAAAVFFMDPLLSLLRTEATLVAEFEAAPNIGVGAPVCIAGRP